MHMQVRRNEMRMLREHWSQFILHECSSVFSSIKLRRWTKIPHTDEWKCFFLRICLNSTSNGATKTQSLSSRRERWGHFSAKSVFLCGLCLSLLSVHCSPWWTTAAQRVCCADSGRTDSLPVCLLRKTLSLDPLLTCNAYSCLSVTQNPLIESHLFLCRRWLQSGVYEAAAAAAHSFRQASRP